MVDSPESMGPEAQGQASKGAAAPRRRFLQQGLAGGSILLLASTRHAVAKGSKGGSCGMLTKSGHQSAVANAHTSAGGKKFCPGKATTTWKKGTGWPTGCYPSNSGRNKATTFTDCYGTGFPPTNAGYKSTDTLLTCLGGATTNAACQFAGAFLNANGGASTYPYTAEQIIGIWQTNYHNTATLNAYASYFGSYLNVM
jgi:hypothetical protein